jgi:ribonuclease HI
VYSDSQYVVKAVKEGWLNKWIKTNFAGGKKNSDLWRRFYELSKKNKIRFEWVRGHADNPYNNRCDILATSAADGGNLAIDKGFESGSAGMM